MHKIHYSRFPVTFPKRRGSYQLVTELYLLATRPTSPQQVAEMEFGKRHDTTDTTDFSRANLLGTCYEETGVMDFDLNAAEKRHPTF